MNETTWKDYIKVLPDGQSYSERVTGSGHITVSALVTLEGKLEAYPPLAGGRAFPVFILINATSGGKISTRFEGKYPQKGWELSAIVHKGYGRLMAIFVGLYKEAHLTPPSAEKQARGLFSEGWRLRKTIVEVALSNINYCESFSWPTGQEKEFTEEIENLFGEEFENLSEVLKILGEKTENSE